MRVRESTPPASISTEPPRASQAPTSSSSPIAAGGWFSSWMPTITNVAVPMPSRRLSGGPPATGRPSAFGTMRMKVARQSAASTMSSASKTVHAERSGSNQSRKRLTNTSRAPSPAAIAPPSMRRSITSERKGRGLLRGLTP